MKTSYLAFGTIGLGLVGLIAACGGAEATDVLGAPGQATASSSSGGSSGSSGTTSGNSSSSSGSSGTSGTTSSSSGHPCIECESPPAGCVSTSTCEHCSFTCPDAGGAIKCQRSAAGDTCPGGSYCDAPDCNIGVCVNKGQAESPGRDPQCGCNGVTYWNSSIAKKAGVAIRQGGACKGDQQPAFCGGFAPNPCPGGASCNNQVKKDNCNQSDGQGTCWMLPTTCPNIVIGGSAHPCGPAIGCTDDCQAIRKGITWFEDSSCPK